jgi:hypothetical protein
VGGHFSRTFGEASGRKPAIPRHVQAGPPPWWPPLSRDEFRKRFEQSFYDPAFEKEQDSIGKLEAIAWDAYVNDRKAPRTAKAGPK